MQGCYVYDTNGNRYLDALAGLFSTALGMSIPLNENFFYLQPDHQRTFGLKENKLQFNNRNFVNR
jgi:acetylornithine/succinyldiaminopimelate/putrescine aminotransferase